MRPVRVAEEHVRIPALNAEVCVARDVSFVATVGERHASHGAGVHVVRRPDAYLSPTTVLADRLDWSGSVAITELHRVLAAEEPREEVIAVDTRLPLRADRVVVRVRRPSHSAFVHVVDSLHV